MLELNLKGKQCPIPVIEVRKEILKLTESEEIQVLVDNEIAATNVTKMAKSMNGKARFDKIKDNEYKVNILIGEVTLAKGELEEKKENTVNGSYTVAIDSNEMGKGDSELGKALMKGFIYALTQAEELPSSVLLYNSGAKLVIEESKSLEDLQYLEKKGVQILTCGMCLNYYKIEEQLAVGSVTNMYEIVNRLTKSTHIVKP